MFNPYKKWLGIPEKDLPPNHYRLLSLELYESDLDVIEGAADRAMGYLRQYQSGENAADAAKLLNEVATARICLLKPASKAEYDAKLRQQLTVRVPETSIDDDAQELALRTFDSPITPRQRRAATAKRSRSKSSSSVPWIPIGIGAGVIVFLAALTLSPRVPRKVGPDSNASSSAPPVNPDSPVVESKPKSAETASAETNNTPAVNSVETKPESSADSVTAKSTEPVAAVVASPSTTLPPSEPPNPASPDAIPQKPWGVAAHEPAVVHSVYLVEGGKWGPLSFCHSPALVETPKGLVAAFAAGSEQGAADAGIWTTRSPKDNMWTPPVQVASGEIDKKTDPNMSHCGSPVLFRYSSAELALCYRVGSDSPVWRGVMKFSTNHGATWGNPQILPAGFIGPTKTKPVLLADKSLFCGSSTENDGWQVHFEYYDGMEWTKTPPINDGRTIQIIEPALLSHGNHRWQAIGRSNRRHGKIYEAWSDDDGKTWGEVSFLEMPNPSSPVDVVKLKDGRFVMVYNHSSTERKFLNVAFSDDGQKWQAALTLENDDQASSHPSVIQTKDGLVHIAYGRFYKHIRHLIFDPTKVRLKPIIDGQWPEQ